MENAAMVDSFIQPKPSSPVSISSMSDNDAVNSSSARVYFGPLQSPEKKYAPDVARRRTLHPGAVDSPLRRSPRLSPAPASPGFKDNVDTHAQTDDDGDVDEAADLTARMSRGGTPENYTLFPQDELEPSSVLASKIMRAHDNPSPPPQRNVVPNSDYSPLKSGPFPQTDEPMSPVPFKSINLLDRLNGCSPLGRVITPSHVSPALPLPIDQSPTLEPDAAGESYQRALVAHISSPTSKPAVCADAAPLDSNTSLLANGSHTNATPHLYENSDIPLSSFNDVPPSPSRDSHSLPDGHFSLVVEESSAEHMDVISGVPTPTQSHVPCADSITSDSFNNAIPSASDKQMTQDIKHVRRSPRRSVTPQPFGVGHATRSLEVPTSKGKERAISPAINAIEGSNESSASRDGMVSGGEKDQGKRLEPRNEGKSMRTNREEDMRAAKRELRSLSPESTNVLTQLLSPMPVSMTELAALIPLPTTNDQQEDKETSQRELRSLSPEAADVLAQLLPSSQQSIPIPVLVVPEASKDAGPSTPKRGPRMHNTPHPNFSNSTLQRPHSPVKLGLMSPQKPSSGIEGGARTPARRVPIEDAIARGTPSQRKTTHLSVRPDMSAPGGKFASLRSPLFARPALDDPRRSPAKRVPVSGTMHFNHGQSVASPSRSLPRARSASVEPKPAPTPSIRSRSVDPSPKPESKSLGSIFQRSAVPSSRTNAKLPFPLVAGNVPGSELPHSIPEENEPPNVHDAGASTTTAKSTLIASPAKSYLKQPSTSSRIPRIGAKPYTRPPPKNEKNQESSSSLKASKDVTSTVTVGNAKSASRLTHSGSGSSDDTAPIVPGPSNSAIKERNGSEFSTSTAFARKQGARTFSPPTAGLPTFRQVVPGMLGAKYAPKVLPEPAVAQASTGTTPQKPNGPIRIRKVVDGMFAKRHDKAPEPLTKESQNIEAGASHSSLGARSDVKSSNLDAFALSTAVTNKSPTPPSSPVPHDKTLSRDRAGIDAREIRDATASPQSEAEPSTKVRRTSRKRKPTLPSSDVFGTVVTRPLQPRKRAPTSTRSDGDGFQGMSAVALKALTSSNTTKNQQFSVKLETKVVRKEGIRPESPTMKARTILQKQREEKDKQRKDRAARRARRSEDGPGLGDADADAATESGDRSAMESDDDENSDRARLGKHLRGPGDEEDYETPERIGRPVKRLKCVDGEGQVEVQKKQVKWDRGLSTTIYLDELHPKPKTPSMDHSTKKGCLTPAVKALRLDTLGNIMNANTPLTDLVHENITVTKFVYDNDQEAQPEVDTIPVKITRSKSKKAKS